MPYAARRVVESLRRCCGRVAGYLQLAMFTIQDGTFAKVGCSVLNASESWDPKWNLRNRAPGREAKMDYGFAFLSAVDIHKDVTLAERSGFTHAWLYDTQMICADVFQCLAL
jgi:hypothetical protein